MNTNVNHKYVKCKFDVDDVSSDEYYEYVMKNKDNVKIVGGGLCLE